MKSRVPEEIVANQMVRVMETSQGVREDEARAYEILSVEQQSSV